MSHVAVPWGWSGDGNWAARLVRRVPLAGVRVCRRRSERVGWASGMETGSGPRKMAFSVLARTEVTKMKRNERMAAIGAIGAIVMVAGLPLRYKSGGVPAAGPYPVYEIRPPGVQSAGAVAAGPVGGTSSDRSSTWKPGMRWKCLPQFFPPGFAPIR